MSVAKITAPWGEFTISCKLDTLRVGRAQLQFFVDQGIAKDAAHAMRDIAAYDEIIGLGCEDTARRFLEIRTRRIRIGERVTVAAAVDELKRKGRWGLA